MVVGAAPRTCPQVGMLAWVHLACAGAYGEGIYNESSKPAPPFSGIHGLRWCRRSRQHGRDGRNDPPWITVFRARVASAVVRSTTLLRQRLTERQEVYVRPDRGKHIYAIARDIAVLPSIAMTSGVPASMTAAPAASPCALRGIVLQRPEHERVQAVSGHGGRRLGCRLSRRAEGTATGRLRKSWDSLPI